MKLKEMIEMLHKLEDKGLGECEIFIDADYNLGINKIELLYNANYDTVDIKYSV